MDEASLARPLAHQIRALCDRYARQHECDDDDDPRLPAMGITLAELLAEHLREGRLPDEIDAVLDDFFAQLRASTWRMIHDADVTESTE